jgi:hypothetical protein
MSDSEKNVLKDEPIHGTGHIEDPDAGLSDEERAVIERRLLWKLDLTLMPWVRRPPQAPSPLLLPTELAMNRVQN